MNIPRKLHCSLPLSSAFPTLSRPPSRPIQASLQSFNMQGTALGKTQDMRVRRKKSIDAETEEVDLKVVMSRSMSVPKGLGKLEASQSTCSTWDESTPVHKRAKQPVWATLNASVDSSKKVTIGRKEPRHAGGFYMSQTSTKMALAAQQTKSSFSPTSPVQTFQDLEAQFLSSQRSIPKGDFQKRLDLYSRHFSAAIKSSGALEGLLSRLKAGYEGLVEEVLRTQEKEAKRGQAEAEDWRERFRREVEGKKGLMSKVEKLTRENVELGEECEKLEVQCSVYEKQLHKASSLSPSGYPPSPEAYSSLLTELKHYKTRTEALTHEVEGLKAKEKKLIAMVQAVKRRESVSKEAEERQQVGQTEEDEEKESVGLVVGRELALKRPVGVPRLSLLAVKPDLFSSSSSDSHPRSQPLSPHSRSGDSSPEV